MIVPYLSFRGVIQLLQTICHIGQGMLKCRNNMGLKNIDIINPCHCMFVYCISNITENTKRASKYIWTKFIYVSRNFSAHCSNNNMRWDLCLFWFQIFQSLPIFVICISTITFILFTIVSDWHADLIKRTWFREMNFRY